MTKLTFPILTVDQIRIRDGAGDGLVLVSGPDGMASWQTVGSGEGGVPGPPGPEGPAGPVGPAGPGVPVGGTTGQILAKASAANYDTAWIPAPSSGTDEVSIGSADPGSSYDLWYQTAISTGVTRVQGTGKAQSSTGTTPLALPAFGTPPVVGHGLVVTISVSGASTVISSVTDNYGNAYTRAGSTFGPSVGAEIWFCAAITITGSAFTITISRSSSTNLCASAVEVSNALAVDQQAGQATSGSGSASTTSTAVLSGPDNFVAAVLTIAGTAGTGIVVQSVTPAWTEEFEDNTGFKREADTRVLTGTAGTTASCSWTHGTGAVNYATRLVAFKSTGGTGTLKARVSDAWQNVTATPSGADTQVQFNDAGVLGGSAGLTYTKATSALTLGGPLTLPAIGTGATGAVARMNGSVLSTGSLALTDLPTIPASRVLGRNSSTSGSPEALTLGRNLEVVSTVLQMTSYRDVPEGTPANPAADTVRLYAVDDNGFTFQEERDSVGRIIRTSRDTVAVGKVDEAGGVVRGECVYVSGAVGANRLLKKALATSRVTTPAFGLAMDSGAQNAFIRILTSGLMAGLDTSAIAEGTRVFLSDTTPGGMTVTPPVAPNLTQRIGWVLRQHATQGEIGVLPSTALSESSWAATHAFMHAAGGRDPLSVTTLGGYPGGTTTFLRADGSFAAPAVGGDVIGPASATGDALAVYDGSTGKVIKNSGIALSGTGLNSMTVPGSLIAADARLRVIVGELSGAADHLYLQYARSQGVYVGQSGGPPSFLTVNGIINNNIVQIYGNDSAANPGQPWMRGNGVNHLVINGGNGGLYFNWDTGYQTVSNSPFMVRSNPPSGAAELDIIGASGTERNIKFYSGPGGTGLRWNIMTGPFAETGGNLGSNLQIQRFDDAGTFLDNALTIGRSNGVVSIVRDLNAFASNIYNPILYIRNDDNSANPGKPWIRGNGTYLVINANDLYLNWDSGAFVFTNSLLVRGEITPVTNSAYKLGRADLHWRGLWIDLDPPTTGYVSVVVNGTDGLAYVTSTRASKAEVTPLALADARRALAVLEPVRYREAGNQDGWFTAGLIAEDVEAAGFTELVGYLNGKAASVHYDRLSVYLAVWAKDLEDRMRRLEEGGPRG